MRCQVLERPNRPAVELNNIDVFSALHSSQRKALAALRARRPRLQAAAHLARCAARHGTRRRTGVSNDGAALALCRPPVLAEGCAFHALGAPLHSSRSVGRAEGRLAVDLPDEVRAARLSTSRCSTWRAASAAPGRARASCPRRASSVYHRLAKSGPTWPAAPGGPDMCIDSQCIHYCSKYSCKHNDIRGYDNTNK